VVGGSVLCTANGVQGVISLFPDADARRGPRYC
jgi:hypothetical protein